MISAGKPALKRLAQRLGTAGLVLALGAATFTSLVFANVLGNRHAARMDTTAAGDHKLSPRTQRLLEQLPPGFEIVLAVDRAGVDRRVLDRVRDVLGEFGRTTDAVTVSEIDVGGSSGAAEFDAVTRRLVERDRDEIDRQAEQLADVLDQAEEAAAFLDNLSPRLQAVGRAIPGSDPAARNNRAFFEQRATICRLLAQQLREPAGNLRDALAAKDSVLGVPDTGAIAAALRPLIESAADEITALAAEVERFASAETAPPAAADAARPLVPQMNQRRDRLNVAADELARMRRPGVLRVASALSANQAALVIGPPGTGMTAIDVGTLLPPSAGYDAAGVSAATEIGRRAEELVSTAVGAVIAPNTPIVIFTHAELRPFVTTVPVYTRLVERLRTRGMDVLEWPVTIEPDPPSTTAIDETGERPLVFVVISPDSTQPSQGAEGTDGSARAQKLGEAIERVSAEGHGVLVSLNPSIFPSFGDTDPIARVLEDFGVSAESGKPILRRTLNSGRTIAGTELTVVGDEDGHPVAAAVRGLRHLIPWAVPLDIASALPEGARAEPLLAASADETLWQESEWLGLWRTPRQQRPLVQDQPTPGGDRDEQDGPWTLAVAAELSGKTTTGRPRRVVAVGSNSWDIDQLWQAAVQIEGRVVPTHPGNIELFEASVQWLAGQDEFIAQSAGARTIAIVQPLSDGARTTIGWLLIGGLPVLVLVVGVVYRVARG